MRVPVYYIFIACFLLVGVSSAHGVGIFHEDFNDNLRNTKLWDLHLEGTGPIVTETNQRLELWIPEDAYGYVFRSGYASIFQLEGDFDLQVAFDLFHWPAANGVRLGLAIDSSAQGRDSPVERVSFGLRDLLVGAEVYLTHFDSGIKGKIPTADSAGKLRMVRRGAVLEGYYYDGGAWVFIGDGVGTRAPVNILLMAWSHDHFFSDQLVKVAFDDLIVHKGQLLNFPQAPAPIPEPSTFLLLGTGLAGLAGYRRRRPPRV